MKNLNLEYAEWITDHYLCHAVQSIDARLGDGYAIKNPTLLSTMICLTAQEFERQNSLIQEKNKSNSQFQVLKNSTKKQNPKFRFCDFGIPVGATLRYINDLNITCEVLSPYNDVKYNNKKTSISAIVNSLLGGSRRGTAYWIYGGKLLLDLYNKKYRR
jgi:hypothetical protein